jgi:hypothetical protein
MRDHFAVPHACAALLLVLAGLLLPLSQAQAAWVQPQGISGACAVFSSAVPPATGLTTGSTNGEVATFNAGDYVTISATLGTATSGTFAIVSNATGTPVLSGPRSIPGTLNYLVTGPLPPGSIGIGYFIDSATGGTVNISATSCGPEPAVPTTSRLGLFAMALALFLIGLVAVARSRVKR